MFSDPPGLQQDLLYCQHIPPLLPSLSYHSALQWLSLKVKQQQVLQPLEFGLHYPIQLFKWHVMVWAKGPLFYVNASITNIS